MNIILLCLTSTVFIFAVRLIGNPPAFSYNLGIIVRVTVKIALGFPSYNYATVTSTIILKLYSNAGDYLYIFHSNSCNKLYVIGHGKRDHFNKFLEIEFCTL